MDRSSFKESERHIGGLAEVLIDVLRLLVPTLLELAGTLKCCYWLAGIRTEC